ncbi:MAG: hypothetical protein ACK48W_10125 [Bacteroidota bacterium]
MRFIPLRRSERHEEAMKVHKVGDLGYGSHRLLFIFSLSLMT